MRGGRRGVRGDAGSATTATLTATPASGYAFTSWGGACSGTSTTTAVLVDAAKTCSATFTASGADLRADDCAGADGRDGDGERADVRDGRRGVRGDAGSSTPATLTAAPATGYTFTSWGGACSGTSTTTASRWMRRRAAGRRSRRAGGPTNGPPYTLTITPPTGGKVAGAGMNCGAGGTACAVTMPAPMTIGIEATASTGYPFTGWSGDCSGTSAWVSVNLQGPRTCTANFSRRRADLLADDCAGADGRDGDGERADVRDGRRGVRGDAGSGTTATLTAAPATGYAFTSWGGACSGTSTTTASRWMRRRAAARRSRRAAPTYSLTIAPVPTGGTVTGSGLTCGAGGAACAVTLAAGRRRR